MVRLRGPVTLLRTCRPVRHEPARVVAAIMAVRSCRRVEISSTMLGHRTLQAQIKSHSVVVIPYCCACTLLKERGADAGQAARSVCTYATMVDEHKEYAINYTSIE